MAVDIYSHLDGVMPQHFFDIIQGLIVCDQQAGKSMPGAVEFSVVEFCFGKYPLPDISDTVLR